jgi:hypothetical protein
VRVPLFSFWDSVGQPKIKLFFILCRYDILSRDLKETKRDLPTALISVHNSAIT